MPTIGEPTLTIPAEIAPLIGAIKERMNPAAVWLFGSRARGDGDPASDWDILVSVPDDSPREILDPLTAWSLKSEAGVRATVLVVKATELAEAWGVPNTLAFDLARHGKRLDV